MLSMLDVEVGYGRTSVIHGVTVEVPADGVAAVMGHNGAGKTTLLRAAVGLLPVRSGRILLDGEDVTGLAPHKRVRRGLAYVPQGQQSFGQMTTTENLQLVADGKRNGASADRRGAGPVPGAARPADRAAPACSRAGSASSSRSPGR